MNIVTEIIKEVEKRVRLIDVAKIEDDFHKEYIKFYLPFNFCYCTETEWMIDRYIIYNWGISQIANEIVMYIRQGFLDATINKKEN